MIAQINIEDRERYANYEAGFLDIFFQHEGKVLSVDEQPRTLEGEWNWTRTVLIEFPSQEAALAWYESAEYQELMQHRVAASVANVAMIRGV
jgi:uncharacterized protein (DUF1330 family)